MSARRIKKVIIGVVVIGAASGYLLYEAIESALAYCYVVDEFVESEHYKLPDSIDGGSYIVRVGGRVKNGTVVRDVEKGWVDFELAGQRSSIRVRYYGPVPKNFEAGKEVFVEGKVGTEGVFEANRILTRCESKYRVRLKTGLSDSKYRYPDTDNE